ncbi:MAG TPA: diacylglycerol kinase [Gammaproteobacteria bacterium]|nr:diacylglycerol kinase [Gammaproteobacteria bacterium]
MADAIPPRATGIERLRKALGYSLLGLASAWRHEAAFRQEVVLLVVASPLALWLGESWLETLILVGVIAMVLVVELLNSAIENIVDSVVSEYNELAGRAKDQGSAAVLLALLLAAGVWIGALVHHFA